MPPVFKKKVAPSAPKKVAVKVVTTSKKSVELPTKKVALTPKSAPRPIPSPQRAVLKTGIPRPTLRVFECLVHLEQAKEHLDKVGISVGEDPEETRNIRDALKEDLNRLLRIYQTYWKQIDIEGSEK